MAPPGRSDPYEPVTQRPNHSIVVNRGEVILAVVVITKGVEFLEGVLDLGFLKDCDEFRLGWGWDSSALPQIK